jgi:glycosyltransferase involved in cell wall biosynthesis
MSCEVPVVGSDSGSIPEVLGNAGELFPEDNVQRLVKRIESLRHSPQKCRELGKIGRERVMTSYSLEVMCEQFGTMYASLYDRQNLR